MTCRRLEKENRKEAKEKARKLEKEQARLEKIRRNTEKISRSSERVGGRSGSLERRRSGDESPVLNQSTVHGIASPSRRPTIFDVFRPSRKGRDRDAAKLSGSSDKDNISTSSNQSGGHHTSIVQSVKQVVQHAVAGGSGGEKSSTSGSGSQKTSASKYKDGSAHPHAGSDAQVSGCWGSTAIKWQLLIFWCLSVLSHGDGSAETRRLQVSNDQGHGPIPASIELGCVRGG